MRIVFILLLALAALSCKEADNAASGGSRMSLSANPQQIGFNGTSSLTVTGTDENGTPLPDGTQVSFSVTEAGSVSPRTVSLIGGTATTTYFATFVSGDITITARSGSVQATTTVSVADNILQNVFVSANPATHASGGGTSLISAVVTDGSGQPLPGIRVQFSTTAGSLQSNGGSVETNENGVATDSLNTDSSATVTATTDEGFSGETTVTVGQGRIVCHMSVNTTSPRVGQTVQFFDTSDDPGDQIVRYHWEFGDGGSADGQNVQHVFSDAGAFEVVHSVIDQQGNTTFCEPFSIEVSP